jgi:hypothetical protein
MSRTAIAVVAVLLALLAGSIGAAYYAGVGPASGGNDDRERLTDFPTGTPMGTAGGGGAGVATASSGPSFAFDIERIEECGRTCRDVTASLHNNGDEPASNVTVFTRIYAGQDNTAEEDQVWSGRETVGALETGGTHTVTKRVELSLQEALAVENNGGWVTIVTTVQSSERTVTFRDSRQVA